MEAKSTWRGVVRKRHFEMNTLEDVILMLRSFSDAGYTGKLQINMNQGGFCALDTEDQAQLAPDYSKPQRVSA